MATNDTPHDAADDDRAQLASDPIDGDGTYPFAGLSRYDDDVDAVELPETVWTQHSSMKYWATHQARHSFGYDGDEVDPSILPERGLNTLIPDLPRATEAEVAWVHPRTGDVIQTAKHNAVINPEKAESVAVNVAAGHNVGTPAEVISDATDSTVSEVQDVIDEFGVESAITRLVAENQQDRVRDVTTGDDALYNIPTDDYTIVNPSQFLPHLVDELQARELGDNVFGELRLQRGGGRATLDIYMDGHHVESPVFADDREPVVVGLQVQWDYFGDWAVRACGQALDWNCTNHINRLTDRKIVKHTGDVESRQDWRRWWSQILDALDEKRDQLARIIEHASAETLDMGELPDDIASEYADADAAPWTALYAYMDLPDYLATHAGKRLRSEAEDAYEPDWWEIHSAATYAVTHHARGDRGMDNAYDQYAGRANDMLMNPAGMEDRIVRNYEADHDPDQQQLAEQGGGSADIRNAFESVADKKQRYEQWERDLQSMGVGVGE